MTEKLLQHQRALKAQWDREQKTECYICKASILIENSCECQTCGKVVCGECSSITGNGPDSWEVECLDCHVARLDKI